jgi:nitroreductase
VCSNERGNGKMKIDDFLELIRKRRSIRRFKSDPIPDEYIEKIIEAARWAMSGANAQPWEFIVVKDQVTKNRMAESYMEVRKEQYIIEKTHVEELRHHQLSTQPRGILGVREAPVVIVVCGDRRTLQATVLAALFIPASAGPDSTYVENMANAVYSLHLAAAALELGSQWVSPSRAWEQPLKVLLDIPEILEIHAVVPIGYPAYDPPPPYRRELKEMAHFEKYDQAKFRSGEDIIKFLYGLRERTKAAYQRAI